MNKKYQECWDYFKTELRSWEFRRTPRNSDFLPTGHRSGIWKLNPLLGVQFPDTNLGMVITEVGKVPRETGRGSRGAAQDAQPPCGASRAGGEVEGAGSGLRGGAVAQRSLPLRERAAELAPSLGASRIAGCCPPPLLPSWLRTHRAGGTAQLWWHPCHPRHRESAANKSSRAAEGSCAFSSPACLSPPSR